MTSRFDNNAMFLTKQVVITDTTPSSITGGSLIIQGGLSTKDSNFTGIVAVNNINITPNKNDIIQEKEAQLNQTETPLDITYFKFNNTDTNAFKASIYVTVNSEIPKHALWEINGIYTINNGWSMTSMFSGDITGVKFLLTNVTEGESSYGQVQYTNSNPNGTTTIRYRATTNAPYGSQVASLAVPGEISGPYTPGRILYANDPNNLSNSDISFNSNVYTIAPASKLIIRNTNEFTNMSNGGALTAMGSASIAKSLFVGEKIGISNTDPAYTLDVNGDINFTGQIYQDGQTFPMFTKDTNGNMFYTGGNIGIGTSSPAYTLDVLGDARISGSISTATLYTDSISSGSMHSTNILSTNISSENIKVTNFTSTNLYSTSLSCTNIQLTNISTDNLNITNTLVVNNITSNNIKILSGSANLQSCTIENSLIVSNTIASSVFTGANMQLSNSLISTNAVITNITSNNILITSGSISGDYILNGNVTVGGSINISNSSGSINMGDGPIYFRTDTNHGLRYGANTFSLAGHQFDGPVLYGYAGGALGTKSTSENLALSWDINGRVGIKTASPQYTLDVSGDARITSSLNCGSVNSTNVTSTNIVGTNVSSGILRTSSLQVGGGTTINAIVNGSVTMGSVATNGATFTVSHGLGATPIFANAIVDKLNASNSEAFSITLKNLTSTEMTFIVRRLDSNDGWTNNYAIKWTAMS